MKTQFSLRYFLTLLICIQFAFTPIVTTQVYAAEGTIVDAGEGADEHSDENFIYSGLLMLTMPIVAVLSVKSLSASGGHCYSPWIFGASAAYYGVMEVMNWEKFEGGSKEALAILQGTDKNLQIATLKKAKEETAKAKEAVENKVSNARTAAIGFGVAGAVAIAEQIAIDIAKSTPAGWAEGCRPAEGAEGDPFVFPFVRNSENTFKDSIALSTEKKIFAPLRDGNKLENFIQTIQNPDGLHSLTLDEYERLKVNPAISLLPSNQQLKYWMKNVVNLMVPTSQASMTTFEQYGIIGGSIAAAVLYSIADSEFIANHGSLFNGYSRGAWYLGAATVGYLAADEFQKVVDDLQERESQYASLLHSLESHSSVADMKLNGTIQNGNVEQAPVLKNPELNNTNSSNDLCMAGSATKAKPISCKRCNAVNKCKKSEIPNGIKYPSSMPRELGTATNLLQQMQNARYSGNTSAANISEGKLGTYAARVRKINKQLQDLANKGRIATGKKPINFARLSKNLMKRYKKSALAAINKLPADKKAAFMAVGGARATKSLDTNVASKMKLPKKLAGIVKDIPKKEKSKDPFADLDFGLDENAKNDTAESKLADNEEYDYGETKDDILKRKDTNIFQVITVRYLKTAYPVLLEEEK